MRVVSLCATNRGYRIADKVLALAAGSEFTVFDYYETAWESPRLDDVGKSTEAYGHQVFEARNIAKGAASLLKPPSMTLGQCSR